MVQFAELKQHLCEKDKSLASLTEKSFLCSRSPQQSGLWKGLAKYLDNKSGYVCVCVCDILSGNFRMGNNQIFNV